jgi:hypothetical protein
MWGTADYGKRNTFCSDVAACRLVDVYQRLKGNVLSASSQYSACCLLGILLNPENGGRIFLRNVSKLLSDYKASYCNRRYSSWSLTWEPHVSSIAFPLPMVVTVNELVLKLLFNDNSLVVRGNSRDVTSCRTVSHSHTNRHDIKIPWHDARKQE